MAYPSITFGCRSLQALTLFHHRLQPGVVDGVGGAQDLAGHHALVAPAPAQVRVDLAAAAQVVARIEHVVGRGRNDHAKKSYGGNRERDSL